MKSSGFCDFNYFHGVPLMKELKMLLRRCLIITIIIMGQIFYLVYLCPCLGLGLCHIFVIYFSLSASFSLLLII